MAEKSVSIAPGSSSIFPILLVNFIGTLGFSLVLPFLVVLVLRFGGNELIYGFLGATYSFFQLIGAPVLGGWSDRQGRRKILLLSQAGTFLAWVVFLVALVVPETRLLAIDSPVLGVFVLTIPLLLLFFARALDGITGGNVSVANAYLADVSSDADRKKNFGLMAASGSLGFIIGPALAGLLGSTAWGEMVPVLAAMAISLLAMLAIAFQLKDCPPSLHRDALNSNKARKVLGQEHKECHRMTEREDQSFRAILRLKFVPMILALYFLIFLAFNFFYVAFPVHAISRLEWDVFSLGVFFSVLSGVMVLFQGPVLNAIGKRFSDVQLVLVGCLPLAAAFWLFQYDSTVMLYLAAVLFSAGNGLMWPSFLAIVARVAGQEHQGAVQGFASSAGSLASIIGLITGGLLYAQLGPGLFIIPAVLLLGIFVFCFRLPRASNT